jgi:hypothetical protein
MSCWSDSAWVAISSAVEASSSDAEALRWVTWSIIPMALLIWATPDDCSWLAAATSWTSSAVFLMAGTSSERSCPDRSATFTLEEATVPISPAALWARSASLRTS